jgi:hypothetical protein
MGTQSVSETLEILTHCRGCLPAADLVEFCGRESFKMYKIIEDLNFHGNGDLDSKQPTFFLEPSDYWLV